MSFLSGESKKDQMIRLQQEKELEDVYARAGNALSYDDRIQFKAAFAYINRDKRRPTITIDLSNVTRYYNLLNVLKTAFFTKGN